MRHENGGVVVEVVDDDILHSDACSIPGNEIILLLVDSEKQLEHGDNADEGKHIEQGTEDIEYQTSEKIGLVRGDILPHHAEKFVHGVVYIIF